MSNVVYCEAELLTPTVGIFAGSSITGSIFGVFEVKDDGSEAAMLVVIELSISVLALSCYQTFQNREY